MPESQCDRYTALAAVPHAHAWLQDLEHFGRSPNTLDAYGRDLADYLAFCQQQRIDVVSATREHIGLFVQELRNRSNPHGSKTHPTALGTGLAPATLQRRLTVVRLFYDYLVELSVRATNPIPRGRYTSANQFGQPAVRGLLRRVYQQPWIPNELQWHAILEALKTASIRDRFMFALAYDAALRREELCALRVEDFDPAHRTVRIRAETTKNARGRTLPYSAATAQLYRAYLQHRRSLSQARGPLFLSNSRRNRAQPITKWTWNKVIAAVADRADVPQLTPHTLRQLCLTDLARAGWELKDIADFAGHASLETTRGYIQISGRELAAKLEAGMRNIHRWRTQMLAEEVI